MQKKGQLTIFIIFAVILIGIILIFFAFQKGLVQQPLSPDAERVYAFVQNCIEQEGVNVIYQVSKNGGYYFPPNLSTGSGIPIYYEKRINYMPSKEQVESEISFFMNQKLFFCTRNFVDFADLNISQQDIRTQTTIENEKIILNINYLISINKGKSTSLIKNFTNPG